MPAVIPVATLKQKGDLAELKVATDLVGQGFRILFPFGEDHLFDLAIFRRGGQSIERVQVKHTRSDGRVVTARCFSHSLTNGKVRVTKQYTAADIEWLAVWDATTDRCFYIPASLLGAGRACVYLRYVAPRNNQRRRITWAEDYARIDQPPRRAAGIDFAAEGP